MTIQTIYFFTNSVLFIGLFSLWSKDSWPNVLIKVSFLALGFWGAYLGFKS